MRTFFSKSRSRDRASAGSPLRNRASSQDGFLLIEVMISAFMVALIVVATFTGFEAANHASNIERLRDEATVLASQSQDQMRSAPASALEALAVVPHTYTKEVGKYVYTISQQARFVGGSESANGCSVTEQKTQVTNALRITSTVTWPHATQPVVESTVITPPTGSALEVDVGNGPAPTEGVAGVTVIVKYIAAGSVAQSTLEATTESGGCVVFGAIPSTLATVEIPELTGFVTVYGGQKWPTKEVTLAPNVTTHFPVTYDRGGAITAIFRYNGNTTYGHLNNNNEPISEPVTGDTFVAYSAGMELPPDFEVGSTRGEVNGLGLYQPKTGSPPMLGYEAKATSPESPKYPAGNLFPFPETEGNGKWQVYAGDCKANNPEGLPTPIAAPTTYVQPARSAEVPVPMSRIALNVYKGREKEVAALGSEAVKNLEVKEAQGVTITNTECSGITPDNETAVNYKHTQYTSVDTNLHYGGHLEAPFQPFGAYQLCVYAKEKKKTYTVSGVDNTVEGTSQNIYLAQLSIQEREELKKAEEAKEKEAKEKRIAEEVPAKTKREKEETAEREAREKYEAAQKKWETEEASQKAKQKEEETTKATRLAKEKTEREKWETEEKAQEAKGKHLKPNLAEKIKTQETNRKVLEATEKTAEEKRKTEEAATKATRTKEEATKPTRETEEKATKAVREKEEATRASREAEEAAKKTARETREAEEAKEGAAITVESGKAGCP